MRHGLLSIVAAIGLSICAEGAMAMPASPAPAAAAAEDGLTLVSGGCGPYAHRGVYGYCRPNRGPRFYGRPYYGPRRFYGGPRFYGPRPFYGYRRFYY